MPLRLKNTSFDYQGGSWVVKVNDKWVSQSESPLSFLPLLESSFTKLSDLVVSSGNDMKSFPITSILVFGLKSQSEYWQGLAIERASEVTISDTVIEALKVVKKEGIGQKNKHAAQRVLLSQKG